MFRRIRAKKLLLRLFPVNDGQISSLLVLVFFHTACFTGRTSPSQHFSKTYGMLVIVNITYERFLRIQFILVSC